MNRLPAVAGRFYPDSKEELQRTIADFSFSKSTGQQKAIAVISPHAGYVYSGSVAAETFSQTVIPRTTIILGPNHHGTGAPLAIMTQGSWQMPFGDMTIESQLATEICKSPIFTDDNSAHIREHSLEVQIPFMQYYGEPHAIVPICVSYISYSDCKLAAEAIAAAIKKNKQPVLIVASTDMTHYESREKAARKDSMAIECINALDPEALYRTAIDNRISMCGFVPTTITLIAANILGASTTKLVRYTDSGAVSGETSQVVGYAGFIIS